MIVFIFSKLLQWLYGWGEITYETKRVLTCFSGLECLAFSLVVTGVCFIELPDILKERKRKKEQSK
jgi:hypothetical protein